MSDIHSRISEIVVERFADNNSKFAEFMGTSEANIRNYRKKSVPKLDFITDMCKKLELSYEWIIEGKEPKDKRQEINELCETSMIYNGKSKSKTLTNQEIPLYDVTATASVSELFEDSKKHISINSIKIPNLPKCDGAIHISGDSMYPLLKSGDIVLYREGHDKDFILWGEMYLVYIVSKMGEEYFAVKYLQKSERPGYIKLVSYNDHHSPKEFPMDCLKKWALIKASIRINSSI